MRRQLQLPFDVLCDIDHHVVREWDIYNPKEKGGIAKPATFILDPGRVVRLASVDQVAKRIAASEVTEYLRCARAVVPGRRSQFPHLSDFVRAIRNSIRYGLRS